MQFWDTIINTAMMGTDKTQVSTGEVPAGLEPAATFIQGNTEKDKEDKFLQLAALTLNYRQCGILPSKKEVMMAVAPAEDRMYCNNTALRTLKDIVREESLPLLKFWLQHCHQKRQIVHPEMAHVLMATGAQQKELQLIIAGCCGKRGEWLAGFNNDWNFFSTQTDEELWLTGTLKQRKEVLRQLRNTDAARAGEWIQQTWEQEDGNTKTNFLEILAENSGPGDIPFLESLAAEKSKRVKETATLLLKQIPGSPIVRMYENVLKEAFVIKKEKILLGMASKTTFQCKLPESLDEVIFKSGIDRLSKTREMTDDEYVISQLVQAVPPSFWENRLNIGPEQIIDLFQKDTSGQKMIPALVNAVTAFRDTRWALNFMQHSPFFYIDIIPLLQAPQQEAYISKFFDKYPDNIIHYATAIAMEWSVALAKNIFSHTAKNPYQYNRSFYNEHIHLVPVEIMEELDKCTPQQEHLRTMWNNMSGYIVKLVTLKDQTIKAFNT